MRLTPAVAGLLFCAGGMLAQADHNAHGWFMYFGDHPLGKSQWGLHLEGQWRRHDVVAKWQQLLLRPAVNYQVSKNVMLTGGYAFVETYRYGDFPARQRFPENRIWQQALITTRFRGQDWQHRLRLEQRFFGGYAARYENRFRYLLRTSIPLPFANRKYYLGLYDEIMYNFGRDVAFNVFDQNRAYVALGRSIARDTRLEIGFLEQTIQQRNGRVFEHNHTLQVAIYSKLPFGRR
jgi:hypothetical protein